MDTHWVAVAQGWSQHLLSEGHWFDSPLSVCWNVLGQDTEPRTAPDVLVGTLHGCHCHQWITVSRFGQKCLLNVYWFRIFGCVSAVLICDTIPVVRSHTLNLTASWDTLPYTIMFPKAKMWVVCCSLLPAHESQVNRDHSQRTDWAHVLTTF